MPTRGSSLWLPEPSLFRALDILERRLLVQMALREQGTPIPSRSPAVKKKVLQADLRMSHQHTPHSGKFPSRESTKAALVAQEPQARLEEQLWQEGPAQLPPLPPTPGRAALQASPLTPAGSSDGPARDVGSQFPRRPSLPTAPPAPTGSKPTAHWAGHASRARWVRCRDDCSADPGQGCPGAFPPVPGLPGTRLGQGARGGGPGHRQEDPSGWGGAPGA